MALNLNNISLRISAGLPRQFPTDPIPQVAFAGRSNVGKSSLINYLIGRKSLARVSSAPGKTITVNFYDVDRQLFLVDLPGYGFAKRQATEQAAWSRLTDGYFTKNPNRDLLRLVVQLVDSRIPPTEDDRMMISYLTEAKIPFILVGTKADKLNATERRESEARLQNLPDLPDGTPIVFCSTLQKEGRDAILSQIARHTSVRL